MKRSQYIFLVLLIGGMSALNPVAIDSFLPAIPDIAKELAVDPGTIGITIGIYTLGNAFGQLFYGPLSDRFGRKPLLITGLTLYVLTGLAASFAPTIELLSLARFGQG
ncbi:MAG: MFS transporter, partial [Rhodospirillales bacterium]|nr:MFS transporter [Rhodospirillales bacterium]